MAAADLPQSDPRYDQIMGFFAPTEKKWAQQLGARWYGPRQIDVGGTIWRCGYTNGMLECVLDLTDSGGVAQPGAVWTYAEAVEAANFVQPS